MIERYTFRERLCHWLTGIAYTYCLATGLAFYTPHLFWMAIVLGGAPTSRFLHPMGGVVFFAAAIWMHEMWRRDMTITPLDREWLSKSGNYATNNPDVPAQDRFNGGQKIFYWVMFYGALLLVLSGFVMWFPEYIPAGMRQLRGVAILIHESAALVTIGAFIIHIYMGLFMVPGSLEAIVRGKVPAYWARAHHRLWLDRVSARR